MTDGSAAATSSVVGPSMLDKTSLRDQVGEVLRDMIVQGVLETGTRINEVELAATLGISRGPLREAIQRLGAEGLIDFRRNRGAFVKEITPQDIHHMYELRETIEVEAARLAARRADNDDVAILQGHIEAVDELLAADSDTAYPSQFDFHQSVLALAKNPYLYRAGADLQVQLRIARLRSGGSPERARQALEEHRAVLAAIAAKDEDAAAGAMRDHLVNSLKQLTSIAGGTPA